MTEGSGFARGYDAGFNAGQAHRHLIACAALIVGAASGFLVALAIVAT